MLQKITSEENIDNIQAQVYDINNASLAADFGFVSCTVTLMFLDPARVNTVILDMQERTLLGGYNLIVCAMSVADHPCPIPFRLTFKEWQLAVAYEEWQLIKYNEDVGTMHNVAQLQFATMLARKAG